ncbi:MAG: helix-turn-helix transcriptional regulator [Methylococcus sp.]
MANHRKITIPSSEVPPELTHKPITPNRGLPPELINFDSLPDSAHVRLPVVVGLYGCSAPTIWRGVKSGRIPAPVKLTENVTAWNVGALRKALAQGEHTHTGKKAG